MQNFTRRLRNAFHALLLTTLTGLPALAQDRLQANDYERSTSYTFNTSRPDLAVDMDATNSTAASLQPGLVGGVAALRVDFANVRIANGERVVMMLKSDNSGLLSTGVLSALTVRTFVSSDPSTVLQTTQLSDKSVTVSLLPGGSGVNQISFPVTQSFNQLELRMSQLITANSAVDVYAVYGTVSPLPVQLTAFAGKATATGIALSWETASERNADYVDVQRAEGLAEGFRSVGRVPCVGNSTQQHAYQFADATRNGRHYYRLREVDVDGKETFSPVVAVDGGALGTLLAAYPTLVTHSLTVTGPIGTHLGLFNQQGQQVQATDIGAAATQQLDVDGLPGGLYFLRDAATGQSTRFLKIASVQ